MDEKALVKSVKLSLVTTGLEENGGIVNTNLIEITPCTLEEVRSLEVDLLEMLKQRVLKQKG